MVGRSGSEVTKHSAALLPPKNDKLNKPKKLSAYLIKGPVGAGSSFTKNSDEIRIKSKSPRPKTMGIGNNFTQHDQDALFRPGGQYIKQQRQVGTGSAHKKSPNLESKGAGYGFAKLNLGADGGRSKNFDLNPFITHSTEHDVLRGQMGSIGEQYVDQRAVKTGSTQNKSFKKCKSDLAEDTLNPGIVGARSKNLCEKPNVLFATDQYADQGKRKAPKKGKKNIGHMSTHEQRTYEALKESVNALKEETRLLSKQMLDEAEISRQIQEENIRLLDQLRLKCPPSVVAQLEAENPNK